MISAMRQARPFSGKRPQPVRAEKGDFDCMDDRRCYKLSDMFETPVTLLQRVRNVQDAESWAEFIRLYEPLLLSYVRGRLAPDTDARDIVQDIFLTLLRVMPTFELDRRRGRFRAWLWRITQTAIIDDARRQRRHKKGRTRWMDDTADRVPERGEPDEEWLRAHRRRVLEHVLSQVRQRTQAKTWFCFEQHVLRGRGCADVAGETGITANAVCANSTRVLAKVRELCAEYDEEFGDEDDQPLSQ